MMRVIVVALALSSLFLFPYPATLLLSFAAGLFLPIVPLGIGILADLYYHTPGAAAVPFATVWGALLSILALVVRRFVKARIID